MVHGSAGHKPSHRSKRSGSVHDGRVKARGTVGKPDIARTCGNGLLKQALDLMSVPAPIAVTRIVKLPEQLMLPE